MAGKKDGTTVEFNGIKVILQKEYQGNIGKSLNSDGVCTDSMSELDCKILFNVCDPVMCPPSRFNFGGKWDMGAQVGSVVQKGIVGSLVLGWGNGDILPICLTGIHAGLENIHSMFGGFRDCLEVAKTSGDSVGICNEIRSLYMCNILWEETLALVNVFGKLQGWLSVKIFGSGGGEYKLWDSSWKRMGESVNFFTKSYATSAFAAFTSRSSDEVGSELCKAAIFGRTPAGGDLLGQLTSPESPPQFTGWFEEDRFTDVNLQSGLIKTQATTGTGQSTYRIFYHIYAGRNKDIRYRVVLKNINGQVMAVNDPGLYQGERLLKKGDSVDQSFTLPNLPPGFIEMCIIIDGVPECGFGSTSSGFSTQYLKDKMIKSSLNDHIDTAEECVPRDRSYIPGLFTSGVKRVCAAYDPDSVGGEWEFVGTCGQDDIGRELGNCYLYSKGIEASLHDTSYNLSKIIPDSQTNHNYTQGQGQDETDEIQDLVNSSAQSEYEELILRFTKQKNKEGRINLISDFRSLINRTLSDEIKIDSHDLIATNLLILAENKKLEDLPSRENGEIENLMIKYDFDVVNGWSAFHLKFESDIWKINDKEVIGDSNNWHSVGEIDGNIFGRDERELSTNLKNENFKNGLNIILDFLNNETRKDDWIEIYKDGKSIKKFDNGEHIKNNVQYSALYASITSVSNNNDIIPDKNYGYQRKMIEIKGDGSSREIDCFGFIRRSGHSQEKQSIIKRFSNLFKSEPKLSYQKLIPYAENIYDLSEDMGDLSHEEAEMYIQTKIGCIRQDLINQEQACERNQENELADATIKLLKEGSEILNKSEQITSNTCTNFDKKLAGDNTYIYKCISDSRAQACIEITGKELPEFDIPKNNSLYLICSQEKQQSLINLGTQIYCECSGLDIDKKAELAKAIIETKEKTPTKDIHEAIQFAKNNEIENKKCDCKGNCDDYETLIETYSKEVGIDPHLALSLIMEESGCNQKATSNTGARGLMQITKTTFNEICKDEFEKIENIEGLSNYKNNLACGFKILKHKYDDNKDGLKQSWAYENSQSAKSNLDACFASYPKYESYKDWDAAMRAYNTQACDNSANVNYVEEINAIHAALTTKKTQPQKSSIKEITIKEWEKWGKGTKKECDTDMQDELTNYWKAVGRKTTEWGCDTHAWSAAFISYIMKESGISKFPVNIAHAKYFKAIRDDNVDYGCKTYSMSDIDKLKEGDLICRNRDSKTPDYNNISDATHCDIITKLTKDSNGTIILRKQIGGNRAGETSAVCGTNGGCTVYQSTHMSAPQSKDYFGFISCQETKEEETSTRKVARNCDGLNNRLGLLFNSEDKDVCNVYTNCYTEQKKILFTTRHKCMECADLVDCNDIYNVDQYGFNICTDSSLVCGI